MSHISYDETILHLTLCTLFYMLKGGFGSKVIATFTRAMSSINLLFVFVKVKVKKSITVL